jgi:NADPH:quinone reductase-like Zn-dependent oxidoreductase/acyl carrier protein
LLRQLATTPPPDGVCLVIPTLNARRVLPGDPVDPTASALWGLAVTAAAELRGVDLRLVDLVDVVDAAPAIARALELSDIEDRLAWRADRLLGAQLVPETATEPGRLTIPEGEWELVMADRGTLDGLGIEPRGRRVPGVGEVEIEVLASGLNFRDVLNLLDMYPGPAGPLGNECGGRVTAVGPGVESVRVGDLVNCIAESTFASHVIARAELTFLVPTSLSTAQAAVFPIAQLTAYLALRRIGRMRAGDRVLIHAGAGGVGLAAVHLALGSGAEVYASAGSEEKRSYLSQLGVRHVFDSRHAATAEEIRAITGGHGVDLLLNSLTGAFIDEGIRALAPGGRFLEIGLRETRTVGEVQAIRDDVVYQTLLLGDFCREDPAAVREMYEAVVTLLAEGRIPAPRTRSFPVAESTAAFHFMAKARQIGRVAITYPASMGAIARRPAAYLVTGGLGALGLHVAEWLAAHGAGQVILMGRSAPSDEATARIAAIEATGARVEVVRGDVSDVADLDNLIGGGAGARNARRLPIRGIIHAAGVTEDAALARVDGDRLERVLRPKVDGATNLARLASAASVDFLVFFSSASALLGSPGQSAYSAANGWLDGFAEQLRGSGLPAVSIAWGAWEGSGMVARVDERARREWTARGVGTLSPEQGLRLLEGAIRAGRARVAAIPMDWARYLGALGADGIPPLLRELAPSGATSSARPDAAPTGDAARDGSISANVVVHSVADEIAALPVRERLVALTDRLRRETAAVMGIQHPEDLELALGFMEQGMDSLMSVELSGRVGRLLGVSLPTTFAFEHPTLNALSRHLLGELELLAPAAGRPTPGDQPTPARAPAEPPSEDTDVEGMSADEATRALLDELEQIGY